MGLPYFDDEPLPPGPKRETFTEKLRRLGVDLHGLVKDHSIPEKESYGGERTRELARKVLTARPFEHRIDAIFRGEADKPCEPGEEG